MSDNKKFRGSKGQVFLIGAIVVVIALVLIKTSINVADVLEKKKFLEAGLEKTEFSNIRSEVTKAAYNAINYTGNMTNVTNSFIAFSENKLSARTIQLDGVSVDATYGNLSASTNVPLNVTVYNFFDIALPQVVLNLSTNYNSPVTFNNLGPGQTASTQFTLNLASSQNITLMLYYQTPTSPTENVVSNVTFLADVNRKTKFVDYFDLRYIDSRGELRDRFFDTVNVN